MDGAIDMMQKAVRSGRPGHENTAWVQVELGNLYLKAENLSEAESAYKSALGNFPRMHSAHAGLGAVYRARGEVTMAIEAFLKAQSMTPVVEYAGALADLYAGAGRPHDVRKQLELVDLQAMMEAASGQKANRQIALIFANHTHNLQVALEIAEADLAIRKDVYTWDAYSWVLYRLGRLQEAAAASGQALRLGTVEPLFREHARDIDAALHPGRQARISSSIGTVSK
jgi:tetratricopeptide (TPR) repeat protein